MLFLCHIMNLQHRFLPTKEEGVDGLLGVTPDQTNILFEVFKERNKDKFNFVEE